MPAGKWKLGSIVFCFNEQHKQKPKSDCGKNDKLTKNFCLLFSVTFPETKVQTEIDRNKFWFPVYHQVLFLIIICLLIIYLLLLPFWKYSNLSPKSFNFFYITNKRPTTNLECTLLYFNYVLHVVCPCFYFLHLRAIYLTKRPEYG